MPAGASPPETYAFVALLSGLPRTLVATVTIVAAVTVAVFMRGRRRRRRIVRRTLLVPVSGAVT
jgi:hypothetical protein